MSKEVKASKKVQYAIRMLIWHTDLARRYRETVKKWIDRNEVDYESDLTRYIEPKVKKENENQLTIYDFIGNQQ